jgi:hypothetical protein
MRRSSLAGYLYALVLMVMAGCASGGSALVSTPPAPSGARPTRAIVKLSTTGTLPAGSRIGGVSATLSYAGGKGLSISPENVALSGAGLGATMIPNTAGAGRVVLGLITVNGIAAGEFATLSFDLADGAPTAADFSIASGASVIDTATQRLAGLGVSIASVTLQ